MPFFAEQCWRTFACVLAMSWESTLINSKLLQACRPERRRQVPEAQVNRW
jgi:hypothetical protein